MKATDLMIGDWINTPAGIAQVELINNSGNNCIVGIIGGNGGIITDLQPIPLTAEILEKNGFMLFRSSFTVWYVENYIWNAPIKYYLRKEDKGWHFGYENHNGYHFICNIMFVHQLQHALKLCGIEKEIII